MEPLPEVAWCFVGFYFFEASIIVQNGICEFLNVKHEAYI